MAQSLPNGKNYKIITRSKELREELEDKLGITLPENAELCSKPDMEIEIFDKDILND